MIAVAATRYRGANEGAAVAALECLIRLVARAATEFRPTAFPGTRLHLAVTARLALTRLPILDTGGVDVVEVFVRDWHAWQGVVFR